MSWYARLWRADVAIGWRRDDVLSGRRDFEIEHAIPSTVEDNVVCLAVLFFMARWCEQ